MSTTRRRPRLLDLYCGAGGAAMGYHRAGFEVVGVDIVPQPRYPFEFHRGDALRALARNGHRFDAFHASPPCKLSTSLKAFSGPWHVELVPDTRAALVATGRPWVIENVPGAPLISPITLCGSSFPGLFVQRHRLFESNFPIAELACDHEGQAARSPGYPVKRYHSGRPIVTMSPVIGVYGRGQGLGEGEVNLWRKAMGIEWMVRDELSQAIPPAYTEFIGLQLMALLRRDEAA